MFGAALDEEPDFPVPTPDAAGSTSACPGLLRRYRALRGTWRV